MSIKKLDKWFNLIKERNYLKIKIKKLNLLKNWDLNNLKIFHKKNFFFNISFFQINIGKNIFYSPLICQNEIRILGIIKSKINNLDIYLLQAKVEPGNVNKIQISPTVQATKSNYKRKHKGKVTNYIEYFLTMKNQFSLKTNIKQTEQGTRYIGKYNRNILLELIDYKKIKLKKNFRWFSKSEIITLLNRNNLINMDTLSIFSCSIKKFKKDQPLISNFKIFKKLKSYKKENKYSFKKISFDYLKKWTFENGKILNFKKNYFSIIGINVKTNNREIREWDQPIIRDNNIGYIGLITKQINFTDHYLLKIKQELGYNFPILTTTINSKNCIHETNKEDNKLLSYFKRKKKIIFSKILSDEGGRFFHNQSRNVVIKLSNKESLKLKKNYVWVSHNQIVDLINNKVISIELRNLFACLNIKNIK